MITGVHQVPLILALMISLCYCRCSDQLSCFRKQLFDFSNPSQDVYEISITADTSFAHSNIRAYGDFNNDLFNDFLVINHSEILMYFYDKDSATFVLHQTIPVFKDCRPLNIYLFDVDGDQTLDATVWGINKDQNCLYPLLNQGNQLVNGTTAPQMFQTTTQPTLLEQRFKVLGKRISTAVLLIFDNQLQQRKLYIFQDNKYETREWDESYESGKVSYQNVPFSDQHWNSFLDLTGDCHPELVITNNKQIEFWVYNSSDELYHLSSVNTTSLLSDTIPLTSVQFSDLNYDGSVDLLIANQTNLMIYYNSRSLTTDDKFCQDYSLSFGFEWDSPSQVTLPEGCYLKQQTIQVIDMDINGYPQIMFTCDSNRPSGKTSLHLYKNKIVQGGLFDPFDQYQSDLDQKINNVGSVHAGSFFDLLENGIADFFVVMYDQSGDLITKTLYNNYLYQNYFFIKGYATDGRKTQKGATVPGASFYYANSIGNDLKVAYLPQLIQSSYNSYPLPYVMAGLGRANNYVQMFRVGRMGSSESWSPIIPNSQLAIYTGNEQPSEWSIRIFTMPKDSLVYAIIVCVFILAVLGSILLCVRCKHKERQESLLSV